METMTDKPCATYWRPNSFEISTSWMHGSTAAPLVDEFSFVDATLGARVGDPAVAAARPCFVAFSGGRDSSAVLAVAADLARRHGLPRPSRSPSSTRVFPSQTSRSGRSWCCRHLGLTRAGPPRVPGGQRPARRGGADFVATPRDDLAGRPAREGRRAGAARRLWVAPHRRGRRRGARPAPRRPGQPLWRREPRKLPAADLRAAGAALAPAPYRSWRGRAQFDDSRCSRGSGPTHERATTGCWPPTSPGSPSRTAELPGVAADPPCSRDGLAQLPTCWRPSTGSRMHEPLLDPGLRPLAGRRGRGRGGYESRTEAMRDAVRRPAARRDPRPAQQGLLQPRVHGRGDPGLRPSPGTGRAWTRSSSTSEVLRAEWLSEFPSAISTPLLHAAWLSTRHPSTRAPPMSPPHDPRCRAGRPRPHRRRVRCSA